MCVWVYFENYPNMAPHYVPSHPVRPRQSESHTGVFHWLVAWTGTFDSDSTASQHLYGVSWPQLASSPHLVHDRQFARKNAWRIVVRLTCGGLPILPIMFISDHSEPARLHTASVQQWQPSPSHWITLFDFLIPAANICYQQSPPAGVIAAHSLSLF